MFVFFFHYLLVSILSRFHRAFRRLSTPYYIYTFSRLPAFFTTPFPQHATGHIYGCKVTNKFPKYKIKNLFFVLRDSDGRLFNVLGLPFVSEPPAVKYSVFTLPPFFIFILYCHLFCLVKILKPFVASKI